MEQRTQCWAPSTAMHSSDYLSCRTEPFIFLSHDIVNNKFQIPNGYVLQVYITPGRDGTLSIEVSETSTSPENCTKVNFDHVVSICLVSANRYTETV
jgi:hypothetical protein